MSDQTIYAFFERDINDAGTERRFKKDSVLPLNAGIFGNYEAAGIVRAATDDEIKAAIAADAPAATTVPATDSKPKAGTKAA